MTGLLFPFLGLIAFGVHRRWRPAIDDFFRACWSGRALAVRLSLHEVADINCCWEGWTALYLSCQNGHTEVVKILLRAGADPNKAVADGSTPLLIASEDGRTEIAELLLAAGADAGVALPRCGSTALLVASLNGHKDVVEMLLCAGADTEKAHRDGLTPLHAASQNGHKAIVQRLLRAGADINKVQNDHATALYIASMLNHPPVVEFLLEAGAEKDLATKNGSTPLYAACANGHKDVVELLLQAGADTDTAERSGETPFHVASKRGFAGIVDLLRQAGADEERSLLLDYLPAVHLVPDTLHFLIASNFQLIPDPRPPLEKLQHSAIHLTIVLLKRNRGTALPIARSILSTFPSTHPTLPLLRSQVQPQVPTGEENDEPKRKRAREM